MCFVAAVTNLTERTATETHIDSSEPIPSSGSPGGRKEAGQEENFWVGASGEIPDDDMGE